eukprot:scaffold171044_cov30-Tisochrysis_lutea.AAC.8
MTQRGMHVERPPSERLAHPEVRGGPRPATSQRRELAHPAPRDRRRGSRAWRPAPVGLAPPIVAVCGWPVQSRW